MQLPIARNGRRRAAPVVVASAYRMSGEKTDDALRLAQPWQNRALYYRDNIGELRYAAQFYGRMLKKLRIFPGFMQPDGNVEPITTGLPVELLDRIQDPGGGRTHIFGMYGQLKFVTGEGYLLGRGIENGEEDWSFVWRDELRFDQAGVVTHIAAPQLPLVTYDLTDSDWEEIRPGDAVAYRMWTPHPRFSKWPDSPMRAVLDMAEELLILTRSVHATATSRLVRSVFLAMPQEISPAPISPDGDEDPLNDPILRDITEHLSSALEDPSQARSLAPYILWASAEYIDKIKTIKLHDTESDYLERDLRTETLRRLNRGLDLPPEVIEGMSDANHWAAWWISDDMWRSHGQPVAEDMTDDFASAYLRPALRDAGFARWAEVVIGYDATAVIVNPDRSKDADEAWDRGAIGYDAYRNAKNFKAEDAQTPDEHEEWLSIKGKGAAVVDTEDPEEGPPPGEPGETSEGTNLPASALSHAHTDDLARFQGAAELAMSHCRELAGKRLRSMKGSCPECLEPLEDVPNAMLASVLGADGMLQLGNPDARALVKGGAESFRAMLGGWGYPDNDARTIGEFLELHAARTLFHERPPAVPASLAHTNGGR